MRIERTISTISWIPSDLLEGMGKMATRMKMAHHDPPPPDSLGPDVHGTLSDLQANDRFRFANELRAFIEVDDDGTITGFGQTGGGLMGATTVGLGVGSITIPALSLNDLRGEPQVTGTSVRFTQATGGRTGAPMPRAVKRPPFIQYFAPTVWTTLELTINADGTHSSAMTGASGFPRHWVFDDDGQLVAKSSVAEYKDWMNTSFGRRTPWGDEDSPALVTEVETQLEKQLQEHIMRGSAKPRIRRVKEGATLVEQGGASDELFLLLNGVLTVEVDGEPIGELGPGAVLGERAVLEGGVRTATLRAVTECKVAATPADRIDEVSLAKLADGHRREEARGYPPATGGRNSRTTFLRELGEVGSDTVAAAHDRARKLPAEFGGEARYPRPFAGQVVAGFGPSHNQQDVANRRVAKQVAELLGALPLGVGFRHRIDLVGHVDHPVRNAMFGGVNEPCPHSCR
ncbi:MAG: cyclic nucleotide-binding domain-containing protein [Acidimicrobiales bacterium]